MFCKSHAENPHTVRVRVLGARCSLERFVWLAQDTVCDVHR